MNKVFLFGTIGFIDNKEKFLTFSVNSRIKYGDSYVNNYISCLVNGYKVKQFLETFEKGDKITVEGVLQIREKDGKKYTTVLVDNYYSEKLKKTTPLEVVEKEVKPLINSNTITDDSDFPF